MKKTSYIIKWKREFSWMKKKKKFHLHDELGVKKGDRVVFAETKPISKTKKGKIIEVIKKWFN